MNKRLLLLPSLALGAAALLLAPAPPSDAYSLFGTELDVASERDFRIHNVFADASANDNQTPVAAFPGWQGANQALWKAAAEWGSGAHGDGSGDPAQNIGDGGANFDFAFGGAAAGAAGGARIVTVLPNCGGGTLAYVMNGGNAWSISFCDEWTWSDGPDAPAGGQIDLQGVGCHEFGHALGLGHSVVLGATMVGAIFEGFEQRSIEDDDRNGVQAIYGAADPEKPRITSVSIDLAGNTIAIDGVSFSPSGNEVWFTSLLPTAPPADPRVIASGVDSPDTTRITVALPPDAGDGDVHVRTALAGGKGLSNGWPVDLPGAPGSPLRIADVRPGIVNSLIPGTDQTVTITGTGFTPVTTLTIDGVALEPTGYTVVDAATITADMPQVTQLGPVEVRVDDGARSASSSITVLAPTSPVLQVGNGESFNANTVTSSAGLDVIFAGPPGELHYVLVSSIKVPSSIPLVTLCMGSNFSDLYEVTNGSIDPAGYDRVNIPLSPQFAVFYFQSLSLSQGVPIPTSNCQEALFLP